MLTTLVNFAFIVNAEEGVKCHRNKDLGDRPANVYYCKDIEKSQCCHLGGSSYGCCVPHLTKEIKDQIRLWGSIILIIAVIIVVCFCCWKDVNYCDFDRPLKDYFCTKTKRSEAEHEDQYYFDNPVYDNVLSG